MRTVDPAGMRLVGEADRTDHTDRTDRADRDAPAAVLTELAAAVEVARHGLGRGMAS
ncbi:hypothetical protein [Planomonospora parontospora]|uniref:hypothetical protein n=1 Tax=Planomonospora parontospora TaxID=58119 RepID=UPI0016701D1C|nr:hypothetical protein [Planomonospora parontospora]GGL37516.1 hypothetical protein GCM10014719_43320 [Planomonospora parontospora subsp. antibiotica]GII17573.1 hypothetical protein Ppa05_42990 [Planomonospora parontospora subsp. antibiotica]